MPWTLKAGKHQLQFWPSVWRGEKQSTVSFLDHLLTVFHSFWMVSRSPESLFAFSHSRISLSWPLLSRFLSVLSLLPDANTEVQTGMIGARLHVPFPVAARSSFGWYFSRFAGNWHRWSARMHFHADHATSRRSYDNSSFLACHPDVYRLNSHDANHSINLALIPRYSQPYSRIGRNHHSADDFPLHLLVNPIPNHVNPSTQATMVLHFQSSRCYHHFSRSRHCHDFKSWRHWWHLEARSYCPRVNQSLVNSIVDEFCYRLVVAFPLYGSVRLTASNRWMGNYGHECSRFHQISQEA